MLYILLVRKQTEDEKHKLQNRVKCFDSNYNNGL